MKRKSLLLTGEIQLKLMQTERTVKRNQDHPDIIQNLDHQKEVLSLTRKVNPEKDQESQEVGLPGELYLRKGKVNRIQAEGVADLLSDREGHCLDREDSASHQREEADHQDVAAALQGEGVNPQDSVAGLSHLGGKDVTVINIREATLRGKPTREIQILSKCYFLYVGGMNKRDLEPRLG